MLRCAQKWRGVGICTVHEESKTTLIDMITSLCLSTCIIDLACQPLLLHNHALSLYVMFLVQMSVCITSPE